MADRLKSGSKQWFDRQRIHRHNGFFGFAAMTKAQMNQIIDSPTTTPAAKKLANDIWYLADRLNGELKRRIDP